MWVNLPTAIGNNGLYRVPRRLLTSETRPGQVEKAILKHLNDPSVPVSVTTFADPKTGGIDYVIGVGKKSATIVNRLAKRSGLVNYPSQVRLVQHVSIKRKVTSLPMTTPTKLVKDLKS